MNRYKYPRTPHLPWSPGKTNDDKVLKSIDHLIERDVVGTIKMDGECSTLYRDFLHARSIDSSNHESRSWLKGFHASIKHLIPEGWRVCGENLYAVHSIEYTDLESYFVGFSLWDDKNLCLSWHDTLSFFEEVGITPVTAISTVGTPISTVDKRFHMFFSDHEGYVIRVTDAFKYEEFGKCVAKYVRAGHVQTEQHWMNKKVIPNRLRA